MHPTATEYDRCAPGLLAFARREDALRFATQHGGQVLSFADLASSYTSF
jgi:nitrous oxide reductase accessory protein NosL